MKRIILALVVVFLASNGFASNGQVCKSSALINGMKIEMALTAPLIIDKNTKKLVKSNYNYKGEQFSEPMIAIGFTAIDKDIRWQKNMHETRFTLWSFGDSVDEKIASDIFNDLFPADNCYQYDFVTLNKGTADYHYLSLAKAMPSPWLDHQNNPIGIAVKYDPERISCTIRGFLFIPKTIEKNIWKEPFQLCLKVDWHYQ